MAKLKDLLVPQLFKSDTSLGQFANHCRMVSHGKPVNNCWTVGGCVLFRVSNFTITNWLRRCGLSTAQVSPAAARARPRRPRRPRLCRIRMDQEGKLCKLRASIHKAKSELFAALGVSLFSCGIFLHIPTLLTDLFSLLSVYPIYPPEISCFVHNQSFVDSLRMTLPVSLQEHLP